MANSQNTSILPGYANKVLTHNSNGSASAADTETRVKRIDGEPLLGVQFASKVSGEVNKIVVSSSSGSSSAVDTETRVKYVDDEPLFGVHRSAGCIRASPPDIHVGYVDPAALGNAHIGSDLLLEEELEFNANNWFTQRRFVKRTNGRALIGQFDGTEEEFQAASLNKGIRKWRMFVENIGINVPMEKIVSYCERSGVIVLNVEQLMSKRFSDGNPSTRQPRSLAVKIEVRREDKDRVMDAAFWPRGLIICG